jgi:hypothetical protein
MTPEPADAEPVLTPPEAASILGIDVALIARYARRAPQHRLERDDGRSAGHSSDSALTEGPSVSLVQVQPAPRRPLPGLAGPNRKGSGGRLRLGRHVGFDALPTSTGQARRARSKSKTPPANRHPGTNRPATHDPDDLSVDTRPCRPSYAIGAGPCAHLRRLPTLERRPGRCRWCRTSA